MTDQGKPERARAAGPRRRRGIHIAEVAALAGVSTATVSRALSMPGRVSEATRNRVLEVVRHTGYTPNVAGRNLRAARSMTVLFVVPTFITPFFSDLLLGVDRFMSEARAITNLIGNAVATMIIARWDGALDLDRARAILDGEPPPEAEVQVTLVTISD